MYENNTLINFRNIKVQGLSVHLYIIRETKVYNLISIIRCNKSCLDGKKMNNL